MTQLATLSREQLEALVMQMQAKGQRSITFKVTAKKADGSGTDGAISAYGLGRFPVTLYRGQWERLIDAMPALQAFIETNAALLSVKS